jgi:hypothetical protein
MVGLSREGLVKQRIVAELGTPDEAICRVIRRSRTGAKYRMGANAKVHCDWL